MLSPGDVVFLDDEDHEGVVVKRWKVSAAALIGDLNLPVFEDGECAYQLEGWPDPDEWIPANRITADWVES